jgi:hypothetical protein
MLSKLDEGTSNVLGYEVKGKLTEEEFEALSKEFKVVIAKYDKARLLLRMNEIPRMELGAVAEDLKLAPYAGEIERYAIVGDSAVVEWVEKLGGSLISGEVKHFEDSQYEEAWRWVQT